MTALRLRAAGLFVVIVSTAATSAARAEVPYDGWRGVRSGGPSYAGIDYGTRPIDGTPRTAPAPYYSSPALVSPPRPAFRKETWAGFYGGGHLGGGLGTIDARGLSGQDISIGGLAGGAHLGYNLQFGQVVGGLELDASWLNMDGTRLFSDTASAATARLDWTASARARLGYAWDNLMLYGTAGIAYGGLGLDVTSAGLSSSHERVSGLVYGAGVEMKLAPQVSGRIEALRYNFNEERFSTSAGALSVGGDVTTLRAGISWHFN